MFVCHPNKGNYFVSDEQKCTNAQHRRKKARQILYSLTLEPHFIIFICSIFYHNNGENTS